MTTELVRDVVIFDEATDTFREEHQYLTLIDGKYRWLTLRAARGNLSGPVERPMGLEVVK